MKNIVGHTYFKRRKTSFPQQSLVSYIRFRNGMNRLKSRTGKDRVLRSRRQLSKTSPNWSKSVSAMSGVSGGRRYSFIKY